MLGIVNNNCLKLYVCIKYIQLIYRHRTCVLVAVLDVEVPVDVATIVCWSCRCCWWWWKKSNRFGFDVKLKIRFVVGEFDKPDWLGKNTCRVICEVRSSDVEEKTNDWENCEAREEDGERQFEEYDVCVGADWTILLIESSFVDEKKSQRNKICKSI